MCGGRWWRRRRAAQRRLPDTSHGRVITKHNQDHGGHARVLLLPSPAGPHTPPAQAYFYRDVFNALIHAPWRYLLAIFFL